MVVCYGKEYCGVAALPASVWSRWCQRGERGTHEKRHKKAYSGGGHGTIGEPDALVGRELVAGVAACLMFRNAGGSVHILSASGAAVMCCAYARTMMYLSLQCSKLCMHV